MLDKLFVFDIETIPDTDILENLTGSTTEDLNEKRRELEEYHIEVSGGNPFPRQPALQDHHRLYKNGLER